MSLKAALSLFLPLLVSAKPSRVDISTSLCSTPSSSASDITEASVQLCRARTLQHGSEIDHLATIVKNSLGKGFFIEAEDTEDNLMANSASIDELVEWTLSLPDGATVEDYDYRLEMARVSLSKPLYQTMTVMASRRNALGVDSAAMAKPVNLNAVAPSKGDDRFSVAPQEPVQPTDNECAELCECAEPLRVQGCINYCEHLLINSIELQRNSSAGSSGTSDRYFPHQHYSLLFEGLHDVSEIEASQETANSMMTSESISASVQASISEVAAEAVSGGRNKLMTRDSIHLLMMLSLGLGILLLLFNQFTQKTFKDDGHFFLPRPKPKKAQSQCNCNKGGDAQSAAASTTDSSGTSSVLSESGSGGYCAPNMCEEEFKGVDAVPMAASVVAPKKRGDSSQVSIKID